MSRTGGSPEVERARTISSSYLLGSDTVASRAGIPGNFRTIANPTRSEISVSRSGLSWLVATANQVPSARISSYSRCVSVILERHAPSLHSQT